MMTIQLDQVDKEFLKKQYKVFTDDMTKDKFCDLFKTILINHYLKNCSRLTCHYLTFVKRSKSSLGDMIPMVDVCF